MFLKALMFILLGGMPLAKAHEVASDSFEKTPELYAELIYRISELNVETDRTAVDGQNSETAEGELSGIQAVINSNRGVKRLIWGKNQVKIDNAFWNATDLFVKIYLDEIKKACEECKVPSLDEVSLELEDIINKGWTSKIVIGVSNIVVERYGGAFINLASRYGFAAGVVKVVGELVEDALLVIFKMPNAHMFCEAITAFVAANTGAFNTFGRVIAHAPKMGASRTMAFARLTATSRVVKKSLRRLTIEMPGFSIDDEALEEFIEENADNRLSHKIINFSAHKLEGSRVQSLSHLGEGIEGFMAKRHRLQKFLNKLEKAQEKAKKKLLNAGPSEKEQIKRQLKTYATIHKKVFLEARYKRFFFLKKRKRTPSLISTAEKTKDLLRGSEYWFFSLKNEILEPNLKFIEGGEASVATGVEALDPIAVDMSERFSTRESSQAQLRKMFSTLDVVSDRSKNLKTRYQSFIMVESFVRYFLPNAVNTMVALKLDKIDGGLKTKFALRKNVGNFLYETDLFIDTLRLVTVSKKHKNPLIEFYIRNYFTEILNFYNFLSQINNIKSLEELISFNKELKVKMKRLKSQRFWINKTLKSFSLSQLKSSIFRTPKVCESLY